MNKASIASRKAPNKPRVYAEQVFISAVSRQGAPTWPVGQIANYHPTLELLDVVEPSTGYHRFVDATAFHFAAV